MPIVLTFFLLLLAAALVAGLVPFKQDRIDDIYSSLLEAEDNLLLTLAFDKSKTQADFDAFLKSWDAANASLKSVLLVCHVLGERSDFSVPDTLLPRLKGGEAVAELHNATIAKHFSRIASALSDNNIPFILIKGAAMKLLNPDMPRWMTDIDLIVDENNFGRSIRLASDLGYGDPMACGYSTDLHIPGSQTAVADIHCRLDLGTGMEERFTGPLFARAEEMPMFSTRGLIPCREDLVFILLVNTFKNLQKKQSGQSILNTFFDLKFLTAANTGLDWARIKSDAELTGTGCQLYIVCRFFAGYLPELFPRGWIESLGANSKDLEKLFVDFKFRHNVLSAGRDKMAGTAVGTRLRTEQSPLVYCWLGLVKMAKPIAGNRIFKRIILRFKSLFHSY